MAQPKVEGNEGNEWKCSPLNYLPFNRKVLVRTGRITDSSLPFITSITFHLQLAKILEWKSKLKTLLTHEYKQ